MYCGHAVPQTDDSNDGANNSDNISGYSNAEHTSISLEDDLDLETTSSIMENEANNLKESSTQIGSTAPPPPPPPKPKKGNKPDKPTQKESNSGQLKVLSDDDIKSIEKDLYSSNSFVSDRDKSNLLDKMEKVKNDSTTAKPVTDSTKTPQLSTDLPKPKFSKKSKGIAYFYKNFIQLKGSYNILVDDELVLQDREYQLKPKNINSKVIIGSIVGVFAILLVSISIIFLSGSPAGYGLVTGVVLDENDRPFDKGATIRLVSIDESVETNSLGFFQFENIPAGLQEIEYIIDGKVVKVDYATVSSTKLSFMYLKPEPVEQFVESTPVAKKPEQPKKEIAKSPPPQTKTSTPKATPTKTTSKPKPASSPYGKVTLAANIDGARFEIDGKVIGAGNLTYSKIKSGSHKYSVSVDGYEKYSGTFNLKSDETKKLTVNLKPLQTAQKKETFESSDYLYSGKTALQSGDFKTAVSDFTEAIKEQPGMADAYHNRGQAYLALKKDDDALADFIKAAEIYQFAKKYNDAISSYNFAIDADDKSLTAYLGRGKLYLNKGEYRKIR
ncbi:tetratricopeptide repeat protein [Candidatus Zixiibacteriota bacterium]